MISQVQQARRRIEAYAIRTPVMTSTTLDHQVGAQVFLKCENFQRVGAFKFRGAYNAISQLSAEEKSNGVITYSSGNHAQAVALACQLLHIKATVVMPNNAPHIKRAATFEYGARIVEYDPLAADRKTIAQQLAQEHGYTTVPPFDHLNVVLGQGTCALEMIEQVGQLGPPLGSYRRGWTAQWLRDCGQSLPSLLPSNRDRARSRRRRQTLVLLPDATERAQSSDDCRWYPNRLTGSGDFSSRTAACGWYGNR